ncbi:MAG: 4Fe-4S binding protein [Deltaproteobacteria bacterium]|nr:4Fe-4S binding protein [Deltaproteobacteria bacterium]
MNQENQSPGPAVEISFAAGADPKETSASPDQDRHKAAAPINFHSPEFNVIDDLNDWSGNYRSFQPLDDLVTADMRHQMERRKRSAFAERPAEETEAVGKTAAALVSASIETKAIKAAGPLTVISRGRTLIVDTEIERALACAKRLGDHQMTCTLVVARKPSPEALSFRPVRPALFEVEDLSIKGAFGGFSAVATINGVQKNLSQADDGQAAVFDLVLDLQPTSAYAGDFPPLGYYTPGQNPADLETALAEIPEMRGRFKKPQFIIFRENRCFHSRSRGRNCRRCLEICPLEAIRSQERKISIDHYLCQGCGGCALVCPAEALRLNEPSPEALQDRLRQKLAGREGPSDYPVTLIISDKEQSGQQDLPSREEKDGDRTVYLEVEQIAQAGPEIPLAALAYGAGEVLIAWGSHNPPGITEAVAGQMEMARTILKGLGLPKDKIRCLSGPMENLGPEKNSPPSLVMDGQSIEYPASPAVFSPGSDKRGTVLLAVQHLYHQSAASQPGLPLPPGSPFGAVTVDQAACTLCLACVTACPSRALSAGGQEPQLRFQESLCHQCGLCQETCPEKAIRLHPRLLCDLETVQTPVILHQAEPFRCIECGLAFTTPAMIRRLQEKLRGHWMYAEERQLRRLRMCGTCRARDALKSEDMKLWNQQ